MLNNLWQRNYHTCKCIAAHALNLCCFLSTKSLFGMIEVSSEIYDHRYSCDLGRNHQITSVGNGFIPNICEVTSIIFLTTNRCLAHATISPILVNYTLKDFSLPVSNSTFQLLYGDHRTLPTSADLSKRLNTYANATFELKKIGDINKRKSIFFIKTLRLTTKKEN